MNRAKIKQRKGYKEFLPKGRNVHGDLVIHFEHLILNDISFHSTRPMDIDDYETFIELLYKIVD